MTMNPLQLPRTAVSAELELRRILAGTRHLNRDEALPQTGDRLRIPGISRVRVSGTHDGRAAEEIGENHLSARALRVSPSPQSLRLRLVKRFTARTKPGPAAAILSLSV